MIKKDLEIKVGSVVTSNDGTANNIIEKSSRTNTKYDRVLNCKIPSDIHELLKARAEQDGISIGSVVRLALKQYLVEKP